MMSMPQAAPGVLPPPVEAGSPLENIAPGGAISPQFGLPRGPEAVPGGVNPIFVPAANDEYTWEQIADVVSNYFTISREQQVRRSGEAWSEGRIETAYQGGATWLQPFRKDSVGAFNRWESTFQTIRRKALVRVIPDANGFLVEVIVEKELEDLPRPERASAGVAAFPNDFSLPTARAGDVSRTFSSPRMVAARARPGARGQDAGRHSCAAQRRDDGGEPVTLALSNTSAIPKAAWSTRWKVPRWLECRVPATACLNSMVARRGRSAA